MARTSFAEIQNEAAYDAAVKRQIFARATAKFRRETPDYEAINLYLNRGRAIDRWTEAVTYTANFVGSFAKQLDDRGILSAKQLEIVRRMMKEAEDRKASYKAKDAELNLTRVYLGEVGKPITVTGTLKAIVEFGTDFGITKLHIFHDAAGNVIVVKGNGAFFECGKGSTVTFVATVKQHKEYQGTKQTVVNRPRKAK